jgi:two-component sensor histidine kinase
MDELNHRSKNLMTLIQTIARRSARDDKEREFVARFSERVTALARHQDELVRSREAHLTLEKLLAYHLKPFMDLGSSRLVAEGPEIHLKPDVAQAIGMAFHELATNAVKYGAMGSDGGTTTVNWDVSGTSDKVFDITWTETGGPAVAEPETVGFGQKVIKNMAAVAVNGTADLHYKPTGVVWHLSASLSDVEFDDDDQV